MIFEDSFGEQVPLVEFFLLPKAGVAGFINIPIYHAWFLVAEEVDPDGNLVEETEDSEFSFNINLN